MADRHLDAPARDCSLQQQLDGVMQLIARGRREMAGRGIAAHDPVLQRVFRRLECPAFDEVLRANRREAPREKTSLQPEPPSPDVLPHAGKCARNRAATSSERARLAAHARLARRSCAPRRQLAPSELRGLVWLAVIALVLSVLLLRAFLSS
jgi:hypothetical protein